MNWSYTVDKNAQEYPDKEAVVYEDRRITYRQLNERVNALAKGLLDMGVGRGDVVAILLYNCSEFIEITFAANKIGAIWLPLNWRLAGEEIAYVLNHAEAKVIFSEMDFSQLISGIGGKLPLIKQYVGVGKDMPPGWQSYDSIIAKNLGSRVPEARVEWDELHRLMYTSGTTAHPKGVMLTYGNLHWKNAAHIIELRISPDDKTLMSAPLYHVGLDIAPTTTWYVGGTVIILRKFDPVDLLKAIQRERATVTVLVPAMINMVLQEPTFDNYDVSSMRLVIDGGEKMPLPLIKKFKEKFPNTWFADAYGLTETVSGDTFLMKERMFDKLGSVGKPVVGLRIRVVDDEDKDVPPGEIGEIVLRGPKVFKGYWKDKDATAAAIRDGWFHTGDIGHMDKDGYLYIDDRKKDMIKSGGENIASPEVERVIYELPQVLEAAVIGIPHPRWLEVPKAFVVVKKGQKLTEQEVVDHCTRKLAKFKVPKEIEFISELPRNPSGKILKRELRERPTKK